MADHEEVLALWKATEGLCLSEDDEAAPFARFLARNPGSSLVARSGGKLVGAITVSHDGRTGWLSRLAVVPELRRQGLGRELARRGVEALRSAGLRQVEIQVLGSNEHARAFWREEGFEERPNVLLLAFR